MILPIHTLRQRLHRLYLTVGILTLIQAGCTLRAQTREDIEHTVNTVLQDPSMRHASLSVAVYNITHSSTVYTYDADRSLVPGSLAKLFTTAIAFRNLGGDFRFHTTLAYAGDIDKEGKLHGNLYIIGGGDPLLGSYRYKQTQPDSLFAAWYKALKSHGIKTIEGKICYDISIFDDQPLLDSWQYGDVGNYYGSGAWGLNFHENMYFLYFKAGDKIGLPAQIVRTQPAVLDIRNLNEVLTGRSDSGDQVVVYGDPTTNTRLCRGTIPLGSKAFPIRASLPNPAAQCAEQFARYLRNHQINVTGAAAEAYSRVEDTHVLLDYYSNPYYVIAQYTNLTSNNMYAECIFKYLGYNSYGKGSYANGAKAVADFFKDNKLDIGGVNIVDGSGLSHNNRVTANMLCSFLSTVSHMPIYNEFSQSLGVVGESGTVKNLLPQLPSNVVVKMKTGTMDGVKSFAGYVTTAKGELLSFAVISNNFDGYGRDMSRRLESILYKIAAL